MSPALLESARRTLLKPSAHSIVMLLHDRQPKPEDIPPSPGVYFFKDAEGKILYVGKAANLRNRLRSYFQNTAGKDIKTLTLLEHASDVETIVTDTEKEALILEDNLIKEHHPRYNIKFRDDKRYLSLKLSIEEEYPALSVVRRVRKDRSLYFGPYPSAHSVRETVKMIRRIFPIRTSLDTPFARRVPPAADIGREAYREVVHQVRLLLEGKGEALLSRLKDKMAREAEQMNFEAAARTRDQIDYVRRVIEKQKVVSHRFLDEDVIGMYRSEAGNSIYILFLRGGKLLGGRGFVLEPSVLSDGEILESFIQQFYSQGNFIPRRILLPVPLPDTSLVQKWLEDEKRARVRIQVPEKGDRQKLVEMARQNALNFLLPRPAREERESKFLVGLKDKLFLSRVPRKIEAFDISNILGTHAVGSMVCFQDARPDKNRYRRFKIRTREGADDYGMMREVLRRRYQRALAENDLPDLVLLDGGKGQLNVGREVFEELNLQGVDLLSLAKERRGEGPRPLPPDQMVEKIYHPKFPEPIIPGKNSPVLNFLDRIRDEAHRFAITYHQKIRGKAAVQSFLREIPGIGEIRQKALLLSFGSMEKIREASLDDLLRVPGMTRKAAQTVYQFFHPEWESPPESRE